MPVIYSNNASTTLSSGINNSTTTIAIASASGFPSIGSGEYYFATIANTNNTKIEVVKVTAGTTSLTVTRAQDGTSAQAFDSGDNFQVRVTAATLEAATKTDVNITAGAIAGAAISNDAIDSQHYVDGSIDTAHIGNNQVTAAKVAADVATQAELDTVSTVASAALPKAGGAMTGAITTNSTFDGVDIATRDAVLTSTTTTASAALPKAGGTMTGDLNFGDDIDANFGGGTDLKIFHDHTNQQNKILSASLPVILAGTTVSLNNGANNENMLVATQDGSVDLYHNNVKKFETTAAGATVTGTLTADLADNSIDSEHYVDGSIDHVHLAADIIDGDNIQDDVINSEHIAAGAIDLEHLSSQSVDEDNLYISNAGSNGQFLSKQSGNNGGLTWATVSSEDFIPDGSVMVFFQANAPTGWTKVTSQNDKTLRVVSGTGGGTGGDWAMSAGETTSSHGGHAHSSAAHTHGGGSLAAGAHTLSTAELASHSHSGTSRHQQTTASLQAGSGNYVARGTSTGSAGSGNSHSHSLSGTSASTTPGDTGSAGSHTHTIAAPQYIDVIICSKDA
jgi:hypothetical protein